ncbi:hypothetical protein [Desulfosarcina variabilis]|uniref:hypothetical protein n=1 Tax=Desulfosarcina variabilis TaxID=2300 RepID=UPI003AFB70E6
MKENKIDCEALSFVFPNEVAKSQTDEVISPEIRKINQRNLQVKQSVAKTLWKMGLKPENVESLLNIKLSPSVTCNWSVPRQRRKNELG